MNSMLLVFVEFIPIVYTNLRAQDLYFFSLTVLFQQSLHAMLNFVCFLYPNSKRIVASLRLKNEIGERQDSLRRLG